MKIFFVFFISVCKKLINKINIIKNIICSKLEIIFKIFNLFMIYHEKYFKRFI